MSRSIKKGWYIDQKLLAKVAKLEEANSRKPIKTWARRSTIAPEFVGHTFQVHNGRTFTSVLVSENMVGHKLGEFALTRAFREHGDHTRKAK